MYPSLSFNSARAGPLHGLWSPTSLQNLDLSSGSSNISLFQNTDLAWRFKPKPIIAYPCAHGRSHTPWMLETKPLYLFLWFYFATMKPVYLSLHDSVFYTWANLHWYVPVFSLFILPSTSNAQKVVLPNCYWWEDSPKVPFQLLQLEMLRSGCRETQERVVLAPSVFRCSY